MALHHGSIKPAFFAWISAALSRPMPEGTEAFHFNLYEGTDSVHVQLMGTEAFIPGEDPATDYWPSAETFSTGEDIFEVPFSRSTKRMGTSLIFKPRRERRTTSSERNA